MPDIVGESESWMDGVWGLNACWVSETLSRPNGERVTLATLAVVTLGPFRSNNREEFPKNFGAKKGGNDGKNGRGDWIRTSDLMLPKQECYLTKIFNIRHLQDQSVLMLIG